MRKIFVITALLTFLAGGFFGSCFAAEHFTDPVISPNSMNLAGSIWIEQNPAAEGSEVAVYDPDGILCGVAVVDEFGGYNVAIYGDDLTSSGVDEGAVAGDKLTFVLYDAATMQEIGQQDLLTYYPGVGTEASQYPPLWENLPQYSMDINYQDSDNDGISDAAEYTAGTEPYHSDSDADGVDDGEDNCGIVFNPFQEDSDGDEIGLRYQLILSSSTKIIGQNRSY